MQEAALLSDAPSSSIKSPKLKVLKIGQYWHPEFSGGADNIFYNLSKRLPELSVDVRGYVVGTERVARESGNAIIPIAPLTTSLPMRLWRTRELAKQLLREHRPDLIASHFALYTCPILDRIQDLPLIVHFHGPWSQESAAGGGNKVSVAVKAAIERSVYRRARKFIVASRAFGKELQSVIKIDDELIQVIPNGIDCSRFNISLSKSQAQDDLGWPRDRPILLAVRRLVRRVGLRELITAMVSVRTRMPDALLMIVGKGVERQALQVQISEAGLDDHVRLIGFLDDDDLAVAYRAANLVVVPSLSLEGFGLTTVEALAAGTPALVTPIGGLPEVVSGLMQDMVLPAATPEALSEGILNALIGRMDLPDESACRRYACERFDWPIVAYQHRDAYASLITQ